MSGVHFKLVMFASHISLFILRLYEAGMVGIVTACFFPPELDGCGRSFIYSSCHVLNSAHLVCAVCSVWS